MRSLSISLLTAGLLLAFPAIAQDSWGNTDPNCAPEFYQGARDAAQAAQEESVRDAQAVNDYYKRIKDAPSDASDKLLSCVDVSWPDMGFSGMLPVIEQFISEVGDKAVAEGCQQMRKKVRDAESLFSTDNLTRQVLGSNSPPPPYTGGTGRPPSGSVPNPLLPGTQPPTQQPPPSNPGGGIIDLIKPQPRPPKGNGGGSQVQP